MTKLIVSAVATAALLSAPALAADISVKGPIYKAAPAVFNWTGWYGGVNAGYGWDPNYQVITPGQDTFSLPLAPEGGFFGLQLGYNWQYAPRWLFGVEADFQFADIKDSLIYDFTVPDVDGTASLRIQHFATIRGRFGHVMDRTLFFVTGGVAFGHFRANLIADYDGGTDGSINAKKWEVGYVVGAGIEHAFANNYTIKIEYQYLDFSLDITGGTGGTVLVGNTELHIFRLGLNRRFSTMP